MEQLQDAFPPPQELIQLAREQLGLLLLRYLVSLTNSKSQPYLNRSGFMYHEFILPYSGPKLHRQVTEALAESWNWLESEGLIASKPQERDRDHIFVTRRGQAVAASKMNLEAYRKGFLLPAEGLDVSLRDHVKPLFLSGDYDTAVFRAFKEVEVRVRRISGLPDDEIGVKLMRRAFGPQGQLADPNMLEAEAKSIADLYAGSIGYFKNPSSHREALSDPAVAADAIALANLLLRLLDRRPKATLGA